MLTSAVLTSRLLLHGPGPNRSLAFEWWVIGLVSIDHPLLSCQSSVNTTGGVDHECSHTELG